MKKTGSIFAGDLPIIALEDPSTGQSRRGLSQVCARMLVRRYKERLTTPELMEMLGCASEGELEALEEPLHSNGGTFMNKCNTNYDA